MKTNIAIKVENLSKVFPLRQPQEDENGNLVHEHWALKDVSFEIKKGESVGIIGPNGSGKSTLLKILAGVTKPTSGKVTIKGKVASILDIGAGFHPELSGRDNVFLNGQIHGFSKKEIETKFDEIVEFSGIGKFINEPVKNYSNGMYLRLAFSIMAHLDFDVYLFDEVFSVGDAEFREKIQREIEKLTNSDKTIIHVSHNTKELYFYTLFIQLEFGKIQIVTSDNSVIDNYLEKKIQKTKNSIYTSTVILNDFSEIESSKDFKINNVKLYQKESEEFYSNQDLFFEIELQKENNESQIDFVLNIGDLQGNIIFTTSPFLTNNYDIKKRGNHKLSCVFPKNLFGIQTYRISLYFLNKTKNNIDFNIPTILLKENTQENIVKSINRVDNLLSFKVNFSFSENKIKTSGIGNWGGLLPILEWEIETP